MGMTQMPPLGSFNDLSNPANRPQRRTKVVTLPVEVLVSKPYIKTVGGWSGMRPVGYRRTYTATVNGVFFMNENKSTFMVNIRHYCYREELPRPMFTFVDSES